MTDALFLADLAGARVGEPFELTGDEGRHAAVVRRIRPGERVLVGDGAGRVAAGVVTRADKQGIVLEIDDLAEREPPALRVVAVQALAKGDRGELAVETMTELGVSAIVPWQASRSIVRWAADERGAKQLARWRSTAREATKQSRRAFLPAVEEAHATAAVCERVRAADLALVLHEDATRPLAGLAIPAAGEVLLVVGPEGGIAPDELAALTAAGGVAVSLGEGVLRTSTAGVVALAQVQALAGRGSA